jgi:RimJ/RimL family protein N-acetyltransferase
MENALLVAERTYLRPLEPADAARIVPWLNDPEVTRYTLRYLPVSVADEQEFIERMRRSERDVVLGVVARGSDALIGMTGLHQIHPSNRHAMFGVAIGDRSAWGQGHGTEATALLVGYAFDSLNLNRVWLQVFVDNERGVRTFKRVGFKKEGVQRQEVFRDGRYHDTLMMAILREEWAAQKR